MKKSILIALFLTMAFQAVSAFADWHGGNRWPGPVTESFRATCSVIWENRYEIRANCRTIDGRWLYNDFDRTGCRSDIANIDGRLTCGTQPGGWLPSGSYLQTCYDCRMFGNSRLECACKDMQGNFRSTSLDVRNCRSDIANINGELRCY